MNLPARISTREYQDMNLLAHIITCSPPAMNLPACDPSIFWSKSHSTAYKTQATRTHYTLRSRWHCVSAARLRSSADHLVEPSRRQAPNTSMDFPSTPIA
ncbi:hypothetical protein DEO72_LG11g1807 [Vigna unguiculata]|uniref:Uncharacterized protein n=1 Tax=Vigna unguiculata TaxID=3917 RepID=A0A4D6NPD7_VIGUN|nr:hypothetical protein DEO72_LG11g1807 [Vigna unguiculata]